MTEEFYYFGTSDKVPMPKRTQSIITTTSIDEALYYAKNKCRVKGGKPVVFKVIPDPKNGGDGIIQRSKFGWTLTRGGTLIKLDQEELQKILDSARNRVDN